MICRPSIAYIESGEFEEFSGYILTHATTTFKAKLLYCFIKMHVYYGKKESNTIPIQKEEDHLKRFLYAFPCREIVF